MSFLDNLMKLFPAKTYTPETFQQEQTQQRDFVSRFAKTYQKPEVLSGFQTVQQRQEKENFQKQLEALGWSVDQETPQEPMQETSQEISRPQEQIKPKIDNPYANWTEEQKKAGIRQDVVSYLESSWLPLTRKFGVPDAISASQWAIESGRQPKDNPVGLMRGGQLLDYGTLEDNARAYAETIRDIVSTNMGKDVDDLKSLEPETILHFLQFDQSGKSGKKRYEGHMPNPQHYIDMIMAMPEWRYYR